jgi:energy-coupling factor transporter ATP-binding protein EcfA2
MSAQTAPSANGGSTSPWHRLMVLLGLKNEPLVLLPEWAEADELPKLASGASEPAAAPPPPQGQGQGQGQFIRFQWELSALADPRRRKVSAAFNSSQPVSNRLGLYGRDDKLETLFDTMMVSDSHAFVYGARGSGKTSLVRVFADYIDQQGAVMIYTACDPHCGFARLIHPYCTTIPATCLPQGQERGFRDDLRRLEGSITARDTVELLSRLDQRCRIIFILDEFDRITDPDVRAEVATLMKLLSDATVPVQLLLVGIAVNVDELLRDHASLRRHLAAVPVGRISPAAIQELIHRGAEQAGLTFDDKASELITGISCGSPYHVRTFCAHAGLHALRNGSTCVDAAATLAGIVQSVDEWSLLSGEDAALFRRLTWAEDDSHAMLAHLARMAAREDVVHVRLLRRELGSKADHVVELLRPALVQLGEDPDELFFGDSVAPQFLLALFLIQQAMTEDEPDETVRAHAGDTASRAVLP